MSKTKNLCSENLKSIREKRNITREQMAKELGYSVFGYRKIEQGTRGLPVNKALIAAEILGCSPMDLYPPVDSEDCV